MKFDELAQMLNDKHFYQLKKCVTSIRRRVSMK
jgi:hypothetical protein